MKIISVETMRELDRRTIAGGTPGRTLMERAGRGLCEALLRFRARTGPAHCRRVAVLAGKGNNGGDGYVVARLLATETKIPVTVYTVCPTDELTGDARANANDLPPNVPVVVTVDRLPDEALQPGTLLVDGLLGTGISGPLRPPFDTIIGQINASSCPAIAIDIPSGLNGDSGKIATAAVQADLTVTMAAPKTGLLTQTGQARCGRLRCVDIGVPSNMLAEAPAAGEATFASDVRSVLGRRPNEAHKKTFGRVLVAGGSVDYVGAPILTGAAVLQSGAGLSTVALPRTARHLVAPSQYALILRAIEDDGEGFFGAASLHGVRNLAQHADAAVVGPGIGLCGNHTPLLQEMLNWDLPLVVDADALKVLAQLDAGKLERSAPSVLTPHPGEMKILLEGFGLNDLISASRTEQAVGLARQTGAFVVLKGMGTVVAAPDGWHAINTSGTNGLASGGTGDVLSGLIAGLLAQQFAPRDACRAAVFIHGRAAEIAPAGDRALTADGLLELIGPALRELTPFA